MGSASSGGESSCSKLFIGENSMHAHFEETQVTSSFIHMICRGSRRPSSWRNATITCTKEEAISEILEIRKTILASENVQETFSAIASKESDCNRLVVRTFS